MVVAPEGFACRECFAEKYPERVKGFPIKTQRLFGNLIQVEAEKSTRVVLEESKCVEGEESERAGVPWDRPYIRRLSCVFFYPNVEAAEKALARIRSATAGFFSKVEYVPINSPRQITIDLRAQSGRYAIVITGSVQSEEIFADFISRVAGKAPGMIYPQLPESIRNIRVVKSLHFGFSRLSDYF
ncbi:MAG: hypothetical protein QXU87_04020 [Candidatus Caldarchaeum sp.]